MMDKLEAKYSAAGLSSCAAPPSGGRAQRVRDVLLVAIGHVVGDADLGGEFGAHPPAGLQYFEQGQRYDPVPRTSVEASCSETWTPERLIVHTCSPRGHFYYPRDSEGNRGTAMYFGVTSPRMPSTRAASSARHGMRGT